jgi:hypothetical protein
MLYNLQFQKSYKATLKLGMFEQMVGNDTVAQKLVDAGFVNVLVTGSGRDREATGTWSRSSRQADVPSQITAIYDLPDPAEPT